MHIISYRSLLIISIVLGTILRFPLNIRFNAGHDNVISLLSAATNQGDFQQVVEDQSYPFDHIVTAQSWVKFFEIKESFAFPRSKETWSLMIDTLLYTSGRCIS